jgi:hypothetical protein
MKKNIHRGSDFRDFLRDEGILEEVEERAMKQALALQLAPLLKENELTQAEMAARMKPVAPPWTGCWTPRTPPSLSRRSARQLARSGSPSRSNWLRRRLTGRGYFTRAILELAFEGES